MQYYKERQYRIKSKKELKKICLDYFIDFDSLYDDKLTFAENVEDIFLPALPDKYQVQWQKFELVHSSCRPVPDKNGVFCVMHNRWIYKYTWKKSKIAGYRKHLSDVKKFLG